MKYSDISAGWKDTGKIVHPTGATQTTLYVPLIANYLINQRYSLNLTIPYYRMHQEQPKTDYGLVTRQNEGIGDITMLLVRTMSNRPYVGVGAGLKMPTGSWKKTGEPVVSGSPSTYPLNMQLGTGTWDPSLAVFYSDFVGKTNVFGNFLYRYTGGRNDLDNRAGDEALLNAGASYMITEQLGPVLMLNLFQTGKDEGPNTKGDNTGVTYAFIAPGIIYAPDRLLSFQLAVELPLYRHVNGIQVTPDYNVFLLSSLNW